MFSSHGTAADAHAADAFINVLRLEAESVSSRSRPWFESKQELFRLEGWPPDGNHRVASRLSGGWRVIARNTESGRSLYPGCRFLRRYKPKGRRIHRIMQDTRTWQEAEKHTQSCKTQEHDVSLIAAVNSWDHSAKSISFQANHNSRRKAAATQD